MRALATCIVAFCLAASPVLAKAAGTGANDSPSTTEAKNSATAVQPGNAPAADPKANAAAKAEPSSSELESEMQELRDLLESQSRQIQEQQQKMQMLEEQLNAATAAKESLTADPAAESASSIGPVSATLANGAGAADDKKPETPTSISIKGITLTPGGFMAAETAWRQRGLTADVNTPFNAIPFTGSTGAHVSEFMASGRQSRISMLVEGKLDNVKIGGYYETDFLSAGTTSNYNQSNSFTLRQRQFWGQAAFNNGFTVTGGQMWSLVTETKKGMDNRTEAAPMVIDAAYNIGFSWMRQYGVRVTKNFDNKVWLGFAVENGETTATFHGQNANFVYGNTGQGGGLLNNQATFAYTKAPDFVFKAVWEPGFGHYEIFGVVSTFRDRIYPCYTATVAAPCLLTGSAFPGSGAFNDSRVGGGVGGNARATFFKKVDLGIHFLGGDGVGRYGTTSLSDVTARLDGTLAPIRAFQGLGTIELHPTSKLDVYLYAGGEYAARTQYLNAAGTSLTVGYGAENNPNFGCYIEQPTSSNNGTTPGAPASCTGDTRDIFEGTAGFWYRFYKGPKGTVQFGTQYSYLERTAWKGTATGTVNGVAGVGNNGSPSAVENMVFTSFRYVLP
ncbi:MAG TPA: hypothetical protein VLW83_13805 [Candidatus Acidoferrales bacterium]|nr:hypothetical protein [Candidatus Acidoferrales bacterium]